jgi:flagellar hook-associated protein 3 FlgL
MRVTSNMLQQRVLADLASVKERMAVTQGQISSGRRVEKASDDPFAARQAVLQRAELEQLDRQRTNADDAAGWLDASDTALQQITDVVHRVRELVVQAANTQTGAAGRQSIAAEITQLVQAVKDSANVKLGDTFLFSGTAAGTPPYQQATGDAYQGDAGAVVRDIGPGVSVQVNTLGSQVLGSGQAAADGRLLHALRDVLDHLGTNDVQALGTTDLQRLDQNLAAISGLRATSGTTSARVDAAASRLDDLSEIVAGRLDASEGVDLASALVALNAQQSAYQASLKSAATLIQPSLLDFLR